MRAGEDLETRWPSSVGPAVESKASVVSLLLPLSAGLQLFWLSEETVEDSQQGKEKTGP